MRYINLFIARVFPIVITLVCIGNVTYSQNITISGTVVDEEDGEPLPFASIGIKGASFGVISNTIGEFDFHIAGTNHSGILVVRMLGYMDFEKDLSQINSAQPLIIKMVNQAITLKEVIIMDSLSGGDIFRIAIEKIKDNYPTNPYALQGFYRDLKKVDDEYVSLLEAAFNIYDKDYTAPRNPTKLRERVGLIEVRKSLDYELVYRQYFDQYNQLEELLLQNNIKYRSFSDEPLFFVNMVRKDIISMGHRDLFEVTLQGDNDFYMGVFIDTESYGIQKLVYHYGDMSQPLEEVSRSGNRMEKIMRIEKTIEFTEFKGKLYLKYMHVNTINNWYERDSDEIIAQTMLEQMLVINNINAENPEWITNSMKMKKYGLQYQDLPYNKSFWENYNVLKDTPLDRQIVKDLEKYETLNQQFQY